MLTRILTVFVTSQENNDVITKILRHIVYFMPDNILGKFHGHSIFSLEVLNFSPNFLKAWKAHSN